MNLRIRNRLVVRVWRPRHGITRLGAHRLSSGGFVLSLRWLMVRVMW